MNKLEKKCLINRDNLNAANYFQSLLQEAYRLKLLSDSEVADIQLQSIKLLARQTERFTGGESTSVKIETAQSLLQSIFYCIGVYLKSFPDADMSIATLKQKPLLELYRHGRKLVEKQLAGAGQLLNALQNDSIVTDNYAYNDTLQNGIPIFFSAYDADFAAHDTPASIDYPLSNDKMDLVGIEYINSYLQKLFLENQFCKNFTTYDIHCLLRGYDDHYQELLVNIFGLVLTNSLGSVLADKNALQLNIEPFDRQYLQQKLEHMPIDNLAALLQDTASKLCLELKIADGQLQQHISATAKDLSVSLKNTLENHQLASIFVSFKKNHPQPVLQFDEGEKMNDELFRSIADEIRECRFVSDKIAIIQKEIHSITDLIDILEGSCIFEGEFADIFRTLGDMEIALLLKKLPKYKIDSDLHFTENEKEWQNKLTCFFNELDLARREGITALAEKLSGAVR